MMTTDTPIDLEGPLQYKKDSDKEDILTDKTGKHQVMMEWERSYMDALVQRLNPFDCFDSILANSSFTTLSCVFIFLSCSSV